MKTDFHKGTYSQDVETLRVGEENFSVADVTLIDFYAPEPTMFFSKTQVDCKSINSNPVMVFSWHGNSNSSMHLHIKKEDAAGKS